MPPSSSEVKSLLSSAVMRTWRTKSDFEVRGDALFLLHGIRAEERRPHSLYTLVLGLVGPFQHALACFQHNRGHFLPLWDAFTSRMAKVSKTHRSVFWRVAGPYQTKPYSNGIGCCSIAI